MGVAVTSSAIDRVCKTLWWDVVKSSGINKQKSARIGNGTVGGMFELAALCDRCLFG